jgi:hypothetical protein
MILALGQAAEVGVADPLRRAVERSLPYLEKAGLAWRNERKCASCHHVTFLVWSHREALDRGFAVDPAKLDEWTRWTLEFSLNSKNKEGKREGGGLDTMAQVILSRPPKADPAPYRELADLIRAARAPDGTWTAGGQLPSQRRPVQETHDASSRWVLRALRSLGLPDEEAETKLRSRKPGETTESLALHALADRSGTSLRELVGRQNADGGWGWTRGEPSDALATGQVLYALSDLATDDAPIRRARAFLIGTQREDGSWRVPSTKAKPKDDAISTYWGSAWATIGLLRTMDR